MKKNLLFAILTISLSSLFGQDIKPEATEVWEPEPTIVTPSKNDMAPSDAVILFDGKSMMALETWDGKEAKWEINDGFLTVVPGTGDIRSIEKFGSCQMHIEFKGVDNGKEGQGSGNSGVFFQNRYEVQILNSFENRTYSNGQAAAIYKQHAPLVNASTALGTWQAYDIIFVAPTWNENGSRKTPGYFTVFHNGVLVQNHVEIQGTTEYIGAPKNAAHGDDHLKIQDHGDKMQFRNIWVRRI